MVQMTLKLSTRKKLDNEDQEQLIEALSYGPQWRHLSELVESTGMTRRNIQWAANGSDGQVLSGDKGLCLLSRATPDEICHAANRLRSQAAEMNKRSIAILRRYHQMRTK